MLQVDRNSVKPPPAVEETYRGVAAPSRPKVNAEAEVAEMPKVRPTAYSPLETLEEACPVLTGCSIGLRAIYEKLLTDQSLCSMIYTWRHVYYNGDLCVYCNADHVIFELPLGACFPKGRRPSQVVKPLGHGPFCYVDLPWHHQSFNMDTKDLGMV